MQREKLASLLSETLQEICPGVERREPEYPQLPLGDLFFEGGFVCLDHWVDAILRSLNRGGEQ